MNENFQLFLFGGIGTILCAIIAGGLAAYILTVQRITKLETTLDFWVNEVGTKALDLLHSPTNHLGLDALIEEYQAHNYDLSTEQWENLRIICAEIQARESVSKDEKLLAILGEALSNHKLMRVGKLAKTETLNQNKS